MTLVPSPDLVQAERRASNVQPPGWELFSTGSPTKQLNVHQTKGKAFKQKLALQPSVVLAGLGQPSRACSMVPGNIVLLIAFLGTEYGR